MNARSIVIVGNGFDVNHGLPSSYAHFKAWLSTNDKGLFDFLERYIDVDGDWWNEFERSLSEIDVPKLIRETPLKIKPIDPRIPPSFSNPASWRLDSVRKAISLNFTEWVKTLDNVKIKKKIEMPEAFLYISFNYTDTLESAYGIEGNRIVYIHGKASRGDELVYGHGKNQFVLEREVMKKYKLRRSEDFYKAGSYGNNEDQLVMSISHFEKRPYEQLMKYGHILRPAVASSDKVYVYGLSFSEVDYPYIDWIVKHNPSLKWQVSWHTEEDKVRILETFRALGVEEYEMFEM